MTVKKEIGGVLAPTFTVFKRDGAIDFNGTMAHTNWLIESGVDVIFALGSTQECATFDEQEYKDLMKAYVEAVNKRVPVCFGVTTCATRSSIKLAQYAETIGADAVFSCAPYYSMLSEDEAIQYHTDVSNSVGLPYLLYNNAEVAKFDFSVATIAKLTYDGVVDMIKDTTGSPVRNLDLKMACKPGTKVFYGDDYGAYQALMIGTDGWTAGIANMIPKECVELWKLVVTEKKYDEGFALWKKMLPLGNMTIGQEYYGLGDWCYWLQIYKEAAKYRNGTNSFLRRPAFELPEADKKILIEEMKKLGY